MFCDAKPIWVKNKRTVKNLQAGFTSCFVCDVDKEYSIKLSASTQYKLYLNGEFISYGPARAAHGYMRVDEFKLKPIKGNNIIAIEVAGYNCSSYYSIPVASFVCAELYENGNVINYTGRDFKAILLDKQRNIFAHRYSAQRTYGEVWNFDCNSEVYSWKTDFDLTSDNVDVCKITDEFIPRDVPYPEYEVINAESIEENGIIKHKPIENLLDVLYIKNVSNVRDGYLQSDWDESPAEELYGDFIPDKNIKCEDKQVIGKDEYIIFKLPYNDSGFIMNNIQVLEDASVHIFFAEYNHGNGMMFTWFRNAINIVKYNLKQSQTEYNLESFEPYTCQYIGIAVTKGKIIASHPSVREYTFPEVDNVSFETEDEELKKIYDAAVRTFRQNVVDVPMDCPGRERGGWLCDSYFTTISEKFFSGKTDVEKVFLNNFVEAKEFPNIPDGMLPMVYPSDQKNVNGKYIPQWAMWYVVQLEEFDKRMENLSIEYYKEICYNLLRFLSKYENSDGLLEKLDNWNFVEWSKANEWTQDVNYPTNMLYYKMLKVMCTLFNDDFLGRKADKLKDKIIEQSFDGNLFCDNAVCDNDGVMKLTGNYSETCQYYAYFFGIADDDKRFDGLKDRIINEFGPDREESDGLIKSAPFIGNYLRIIILMRMGYFNLALNDIKGYFLYMAEITGTLWEKNSIEELKYAGSMNHGFASFAGVAIAYSVAGIIEINYKDKTVLYDRDYKAGIDYNIKIKTNDGKIVVCELNRTKSFDLPKNWTGIPVKKQVKCI